LGDEADRVRDLLLPLAYAQGTGLPWEDIWPALARALTGHPCTSRDLDWLIDVAGYYITESTTDDGRRSTYRLFHEALAEHLRGQREDVSRDQTVIVDTLAGHAPRLADGHPDWGRAHPYARVHLAQHAVGTPRLDELAADPRFLLTASPPQLLSALPSATSPTTRATADAYARAAGRLRTSLPCHHPAYLQLAARCGRAPLLADSVNSSRMPLSWVTDWASWRLQPPHVTFTGHTGWVTAVAFGQLDGRPVAISGSNDNTVRVWDAATGTPIGDPFTGHISRVNAVAFGQLDGRPVAISGSDDHTMRVWDAATGTPVCGCLSRPETPVRPDSIDLASPVLGLAFDTCCRLVVSTELGLVALRFPSPGRSFPPQ
ncbi:MAG TPA: hypothetical protein VFP72_19345, partial [Kineosporiaceae bacterium]|nr:hypothetical protein [Kineosporiaceae bacterium]